MSSPVPPKAISAKHLQELFFIILNSNKDSLAVALTSHKGQISQILWIKSGGKIMKILVEI